MLVTEPTWTLHFDQQTSRARMTLEGPQTADTLMAALDAAANSSEYQAATRRLWDIRGADLGALNFGALTGAREHQIALGGRAARVAIVARTSLQFGVARQFEALSDSRLPSNIQVFRTMEEAEAWLAEEPTD